MYYVGIDVGGMSLKAGLIDREGNILKKMSVKTVPGREGKLIVEDLAKLIKDIIITENYQSMRNYTHHKGVSTYKHSLEVAYLCYKHYIKKERKYNVEELVKAALLHDYYLYDWHHTGEGHRLHGFFHPGKALRNAERDYGPLTKVERLAIKHHMFPLTIIPPHTKIGWLVCYYDKVATIRDYRKKKAKK